MACSMSPHVENPLLLHSSPTYQSKAKANDEKKQNETLGDICCACSCLDNNRNVGRFVARSMHLICRKSRAQTVGGGEGIGLLSLLITAHERDFVSNQIKELYM